MNQLSFGIKMAPAEINQILDQILKRLSKMISYFYDIVVYGKTKEECEMYLFACSTWFNIPLLGKEIKLKDKTLHAKNSTGGESEIKILP